MIERNRTPEIILDDLLRWLAMDLENARWILSETGYLDDFFVEKLKNRVDNIVENITAVRERFKSGHNENHRRHTRQDI